VLSQLTAPPTSNEQAGPAAEWVGLGFGDAELGFADGAADLMVGALVIALGVARTGVV